MLFFKKRLILTALFATVAIGASAQELQINEEPAIGALMDRWTRQNRSGATVSGWRVQLAAATERNQAEQGKLRFLSVYPNVPADWTHEKPYYKLRAGAFRSRAEAQAFAAEVQQLFPGAFPARENAIPARDFVNF
ncbi:MAG: SPOR domain-containing protein [Saprospiraceae bacterium]